MGIFSSQSAEIALSTDAFIFKHPKLLVYPIILLVLSVISWILIWGVFLFYIGPYIFVLIFLVPAVIAVYVIFAAVIYTRSITQNKQIGLLHSFVKAATYPKQILELSIFAAIFFVVLGRVVGSPRQAFKSPLLWLFRWWVAMLGVISAGVAIYFIVPLMLDTRCGIISGIKMNRDLITKKLSNYFYGVSWSNIYFGILFFGGFAILAMGALLLSKYQTFAGYLVFLGFAVMVLGFLLGIIAEEIFKSIFYDQINSISKLPSPLSSKMIKNNTRYY